MLIVTGYLIGSPPPTMQIGEATSQFVFGYIRFAHFAAGMILTVGFFGRIYWAFVGNHHARQMFYLPFWNARWWREVFFELRWYLFLETEPKKYVGHNPLAQMAMFFFVTLGMTFMIITGFALYAEGARARHRCRTCCSAGCWGWWATASGCTRCTIWACGAIVIFTIIHIYAAIREDIMSRQSMVSTMISGHRTFKDDRVE